MPFDGSGNYVVPAGTAGVPNTVIDSTKYNTLLSDLQTALTLCVTRNGQSAAQANLPMGGFKHTGLGAGTGTGDSLRWEQLFSQGAETAIVSAATLDIGAVNSSFLRVTGSTGPITSLGTNYNGPRWLRFVDAAPASLTYNATTLITPLATNVTLVQGDVVVAWPKATSTVPDGWIVQVLRASVTPAQLQNQTYTAGTTGGTSSAFTLTLAPAPVAYAENQEFDVEFNAASTGTPTLNVNGLGAKSLKYRDALGVLTSCGTLIPSGWRSKVTYDGTDMIVREMPTAVVTLGQGRMTKVSSNLVFARYQGRFLTANGVIYEIPSGGITIAPTSNTANTLYYQYAVISGGALSSTGEYSATGYTVGSDGVAYKTGDTSRVLVGMARSGTSGGTWSSIATEVRSWFNRGNVTAETVLAASITTGTNGSVVELDSAFRAGFVCFADDAVEVVLDLNVGNSSTTNYTYFVIGIDSSATGSGKYSPQQDYDTTNVAYDRKCYWKGTLSEGYHDARCLGFQTSAATLTVGGGAGIQGSRFNVSVNGG